MFKREEFSLYLRRRVAQLLIDQSSDDIREVAVYTLSDPRDLLEVRYVGQTTSPRRRYSQHINKARLWLPDEVPWWIKLPKQRPLYEWIRELHRDEARLPVMSVVAWHDDINAARSAERALIFAHLEQQRQLLNVEAEVRPVGRPRRRSTGKDK